MTREEFIKDLTDQLIKAGFRKEEEKYLLDLSGKMFEIEPFGVGEFDGRVVETIMINYDSKRLGGLIVYLEDGVEEVLKEIKSIIRI